MALNGSSEDPKWRRSIDVNPGQKLLVRLATHNDYTGVVDIDRHHHIYSGHDYVSEIYHEILQEALAYSFVGVLNGTIVYFTVMHIAEEGQTSVSCAARISEACRGQKIAAVARKLVYEIIQENFPTVVRDRWTGVLWDNTLVAARKTVPEFKMLHTWNFVAVSFHGDQLQEFLARLPPQTRNERDSVVQLTQTMAANIISDIDQCRRIFPAVQNIFVGYNWMPCTVPTQQAGQISAQMNFYGVYRNGTELIAVGTTFGFPTSYGTDFQVFYYGKPDLDSVQAFAMAFLHDLVKHCACGRPLTFGFSFPVEVEMTAVRNLFAGYECPTERKAAYMAKL